MADPLSIAASVVGILAAAGKVIEILGPYMSAVKATPRIAVSVHSEVVNSRIILSALHSLLENLGATSRNRTMLIPIDDLIAVFTNGVLIFSELESSVSPMNLGSFDRIMARMQWVRMEGELSAILERLRMFKETMMLLLNVLQCGSDHRAAQNQDELSIRILKLVQNAELSRRLENISDTFDALSQIDPKRLSESQRLSDDVAEVQSLYSADTTKPDTEHSASQPSPKSTPTITTFEFQSALDESFPYRRARNGTVDFSTRGSVAVASNAGSVFSGISLSDVSILSRIAIPVFPADISNSHHYTFMPSTVAKVYVARRPTEATIGRWVVFVRRVAIPREFRFDLQFEVPVIFLCPPKNRMGPVKGIPIIFIDGSDDSLKYSMTNLLSGVPPKPQRRTSRATLRPDNERASWLTLLSALQQGEHDSQAWQMRLWEKHFEAQTRKSNDRIPNSFSDDCDNCVHSFKETRTLSVAIQRQAKSWDTLPRNFKKPYAVTVWCHIVELAAVLKVHWTELDFGRQTYRAQGNGFTLIGENVTNLGVVFTVQQHGRFHFAENTIIPAYEVKELCFGFVPIILKNRPNLRPFTSIIERLRGPSTISTSTVKDIVRSLSYIGCNAAALNVFNNGGRVAHIFPLIFEIIGTLAINLHIENSTFRMLPNPTSQQWERTGFSLDLMLRAFNNRMKRMIQVRRGTPSLVQRRILGLARQIINHAGPMPEDVSVTRTPSLLLLSQLHEAVDQCSAILAASQIVRRPIAKAYTTQSALVSSGQGSGNYPRVQTVEEVRRARETVRSNMVLVCLRLHIQAVLSGLNKVANASQTIQTEQSSAQGEQGGREATEMWDQLDLASPELKQEKLMQIYFHLVRPQVVSQMDNSASPDKPEVGLRHDSPGDDGESTDDEDGVEWIDGESDKEHMDGEIYRPPSLWELDDVSPEDIWCTLVFRSTCWLMLHDFHPHDVNIVPTELYGSRIPVYIA